MVAPLLRLFLNNFLRGRLLRSQKRLDKLLHRLPSPKRFRGLAQSLIYDPAFLAGRHKMRPVSTDRFFDMEIQFSD